MPWMAIRQPSIFGAVDEGLTQLHVEPLGAQPPWDYPVRHFRKIRAWDPSPTQEAWRRHLLLHCSSRAETAIANIFRDLDFPRFGTQRVERRPRVAMQLLHCPAAPWTIRQRQKLATKRPKRWKSASHSTSIRPRLRRTGETLNGGRRSAQRSLIPPNKNGGGAAGKRNQ
jgi:hypothetical protein